jgi:hypothetical protein
MPKAWRTGRRGGWRAPAACRDADEEVVGAVRADRHEGAGAQRDLAAVADQDVHAQRRQRHDQEGDQDGAEHVVAGEHRHQEEGDEEQRGDAPAVLQDREDLQVAAVAGLELAVFAVEHGFEVLTPDR